MGTQYEFTDIVAAQRYFDELRNDTPEMRELLCKLLSTEQPIRPSGRPLPQAKREPVEEEEPSGPIDTPAAKAILEYAEAHFSGKSFSRAEFEELSGEKMNRNLLGKLVQTGQLVKTGDRKNTRYQLPE